MRLNKTFIKIILLILIILTATLSLSYAECCTTTLRIPLISGTHQISKTNPDSPESLKDNFIKTYSDIQIGKFIRCGYLSEDNIIRYPHRQTGFVYVYKYPGNNDRNIAYIEDHNYSDSILVPADSGIDIFTTDACSCPILIMHLVDKNNGNRPYIFLSHVFQDDIEEQINNIIASLRKANMEPQDIIFSPGSNSVYLEGIVKTALEGFLKNGKPIYLKRNSSYGAKVLVTNDGWVICHYDGQKTPFYEPGSWTSETKVKVDYSNRKNIVVLFDIVPDFVIPVHPYTIKSLTFNSTGSDALIQMDNNQINLMKLENEEIIHTFYTAKQQVLAVAMSHDNKKTIVAYNPATITLWDNEKGDKLESREVPSLIRDEKNINSITFSSDDSFVAIGYSDGFIRLVNSENFSAIIQEIDSEELYYQIKIAISPDDKKILISGVSKIHSSTTTLILYDSKTKKKQLQFNIHANTISSIGFSKDTSIIYFTTTDGRAILLDAKTGEQLFSVCNNGIPIISGYLTQDNKNLLLAGNDGKIREYKIDLTTIKSNGLIRDKNPATCL